jgi:limonene 1,2-monooxygenase
VRAAYKDVEYGIEQRFRYYQSKRFGAMLLLAHEWASPEATKRSFELVAQHVMPPFEGQAQATLDPNARATDTRTGHAEQQSQAVAPMTEKYENEVAAGCA